MGTGLEDWFGGLTVDVVVAGGVVADDEGADGVPHPAPSSAAPASAQIRQAFHDLGITPPGSLHPGAPASGCYAGTHSSGSTITGSAFSSWTYLIPRIHEAAAATSIRTTDAENTMRRPWTKGPEMSWGKNVLPVMKLALAAGRPLSATEQGLHGVVAKEGGEEAAHRR